MDIFLFMMKLVDVYLRLVYIQILHWDDTQSFKNIAAP